MPPRKRAASAPKTEDEQTTDAPAEVQDDASDPDPEDPPAQPDEPNEPQRSDIQTDDEPCPECFPGGWTAQHNSVGALGCEHGTWQRAPAN